MKRLLPLALAFALALSGCTPAASSPSEAPGETPSPVPAASSQAPAPSKPSVYTDASKLTPYEKPKPPVSKFTRRYAGFTDHLIPAEDYGFLIPFPGVTVARNDADPYWDWGGVDYLYGLMTLEGEVVADPVFSAASAPSYWDERSQQSRELDCLVLRKVVKNTDGEPMEIAALCARDGSWCTGFDYTFDWELFLDRSQENVIPMRRRGDSAQSLLGEDLVFLDVRTGEELGASITNSEAFSEGLCTMEAASGWGYVDASGSWVIDPMYDEAYGFQNGMALVRSKDSGRAYQYIDPSGKTLYTFPEDAEWVSSRGNYISYAVDGQEYLLDRDWNSHSASLPEDFTNAIAEGDWFYQDMPDPDSPALGSCAFWNPGTGTRLDFPGLRQYLYTITDGYTLLCTPADLTRDEEGYLVCYDDYYTLLHLPTGETAYLGRWEAAHFQRDGVTGELYLYLMDPNSHRNEVRALDGETLYRTDNPGFWYTGLFDRKALDAKKNVVTLTDLKTGELLFSWPLHPAAD